MHQASPTSTRSAPRRSRESSELRTLVSFAPYLGAGTLFGFVAIRSEIVSWFHIQEMFRFQSFHMYGVIFSAIAVGALSLYLIRRFDGKTVAGEPISLQPKNRTWFRYIAGGTLFGLGWALVGACPGPMLALIGAGFPTILIAVAGAIAGTWVYGISREWLPHG